MFKGFQVFFGSEDGFFLRDETVPPIAISDLHEVSAFSQGRDVLQ
jgi:hypothetical protein